MKHIVNAANVVVPALLALEHMGFTVTTKQISDALYFRACRGDEEYLADDSLALLGLVKLVEVRGWDWSATDVEIDRVLAQYRLNPV